MKGYVIALDQGTTSSRAIVFDRAGQIVSIAQYDYPQIYPRPGWVEHDPADILGTQIRALAEAFEKSGVAAEDIAAIGVTNQRETSLVWDRTTGKPVYNAIVWQCQDTLDTRKRAGRARAGRARRAHLRHRGLLAHLEPHRRAGAHLGLLQLFTHNAL